jgi:hypothetical protein
VVTAGYIERHIAIAAIVAVEEPPLLIAMERVVRGVEVQHDLPRCLGVRIEKNVRQQGFDRFGTVGDLLVALRVPLRRQFQAVERAR